jgi:hypothetical protein
MGDTKFLPSHAAKLGFDVNVAMDELREHGLLEESDPEIVRLISRKL